MFFFFKQKTAYEMRISDWSSDVCSSDLYGSPNCPPPSCPSSWKLLGLYTVPTTYSYSRRTNVCETSESYTVVEPTCESSIQSGAVQCTPPSCPFGYQDLNIISAYVAGHDSSYSGRYARSRLDRKSPRLN